MTPEFSLHRGPPGFAFEPVATRAFGQLMAARPFPRLVTVSAPPGYGKTVLLSSLYQEMLARGRRCVWLTLDDRDADLSLLLLRLRAALGHAGVARPDTLGGPQQALHGLDAPVDSMLGLLSPIGSSTVLFIDNLGCCVDPGLERFLAGIVFNADVGLSLVLSSTHEIPLDAARAKLEVGAIEFQARHISFDRAAAASLFTQAGMAAVSDGELDHIVAKTEGWPAAVRLVQLLVASEWDPGSHEPASVSVAEVLLRFGGDHRDMARMLTHRVLGAFDPDTVAFMAEMALVREFNAELAVHMTGRADARRWLDMLVSRNVLTFPLEGHRRWLRFHTLMREFLLAEAGDRIPAARRRELLERAAQWHKGRGDDVAALDIALEAGAISLAEELLDRVARVAVGVRGQMGTLVRWVDRLVQVGGRASLEVQGWFVWALCDSLQYERARHALDDFEREISSQPASAGHGAAPSRLLFLRMLVDVFIDRLDTAFDQASGWLDRGEDGDALTVASVTSIAAIAEIDRGELLAARTRMQQARSAIDRSDSAYGLAWVCTLRACVEIGQARPAAADALLREARSQVARTIGNEASVLVTLDFVHARALLDLGRTAAARELALRGLAGAAHHGIIASLEQGLAASVAFWGEPGDEAVADTLLERVANSYSARGPRLLGASKVRRLLALGRHDEGLAEAARVGLDANKHEPSLPPMRERGDWLLARLELHLAQGACAAVLDQVEAHLKTARVQGRDRDRIELLLIAADAQQRLGHQRLALRAFSMAISLAAPGKVMQPFLARGGLWSRLLAGGDRKGLGLVQAFDLAFFERLRLQLSANADASDKPEPEYESATVGALTLRQIQLLALLDEGFSNEQVADRLGLSVPTVKWHLHNAYVQLGVRSRSAALARARALKLLSR